jgi:hypothetical protein
VVSCFKVMVVFLPCCPSFRRRPFMSDHTKKECQGGTGINSEAVYAGKILDIP